MNFECPGSQSAMAMTRRSSRLQLKGRANTVEEIDPDKNLFEEIGDDERHDVSDEDEEWSEENDNIERRPKSKIKKAKLNEKENPREDIEVPKCKYELIREEIIKERESCLEYQKAREDIDTCKVEIGFKSDQHVPSASSKTVQTDSEALKECAGEDKCDDSGQTITRGGGEPEQERRGDIGIESTDKGRTVEAEKSNKTDKEGSVREFGGSSTVDVKNVEKNKFNDSDLFVKFARLPNVTIVRLVNNKRDVQVEKEQLDNKYNECNLNSDMNVSKKIPKLSKLLPCIKMNKVVGVDMDDGFTKGGGEKIMKCALDQFLSSATHPGRKEGEVGRLELKKKQTPGVLREKIVDLTADEEVVDLTEDLKEEKPVFKEEPPSSSCQGEVGRAVGCGERKRKMLADPSRILSPCMMSSYNSRKFINPRQIISPRHQRFLIPSPCQKSSPRPSPFLSPNPRKYMSPRVKIPGSRVMSPCIIRVPGIVMPPRRFLLPSSLKPPTSRGVLTSLSRHRLPGIARPRLAPEVTLVLPSGPGNVEIKLNSSQVNQLRSGLQGVKGEPGRRE